MFHLKKKKKKKKKKKEKKKKNLIYSYLKKIFNKFI